MNAATITASALGACLRPAPATEQQEVIEDEPTHLEVSLGTQVGRTDASATTRACVIVVLILYSHASAVLGLGVAPTYSPDYMTLGTV